MKYSASEMVGLPATLTLHVKGGKQTLRLGILEMEVNHGTVGMTPIGSVYQRLVMHGPRTFKFTATELPPEKPRRRGMRMPAAMEAD